MKNIKRLIITIFLTCSTYLSPIIREEANRVCKTLGNCTDELTTTLDTNMNKAVETVNKSVDKLTQSADKIAQSSEALGKGLVIAGQAAVCIIAAKQLYDAGKDIASYVKPSEEQKMKENKAKNYNEKLKAKREFRGCLIKNAQMPRNEFNRPSVCEEYARMFGMLGGARKLDKMTNTFTSVYGK